MCMSLLSGTWSTSLYLPHIEEPTNIALSICGLGDHVRKQGRLYLKHVAYFFQTTHNSATTTHLSVLSLLSFTQWVWTALPEFGPNEIPGIIQSPAERPSPLDSFSCVPSGRLSSVCTNPYHFACVTAIPRMWASWAWWPKGCFTQQRHRLKYIAQKLHPLWYFWLHQEGLMLVMLRLTPFCPFPVSSFK